MIRLALLLLGVLSSAFRSRADLLIENLALRQQLSVVASSNRRRRITAADRLFWVVLQRVWSRWSEVLLFVKPETVIQWHRRLPQVLDLALATSAHRPAFDPLWSTRIDPALGD